TARFVGGVVRDALLGLPVADLDLATTLSPDEVVERLSEAGIKAIPTGIEHGTVTAVSSGTVVEVTTLRCDVSTDGRRATVAFTDDWAEDAKRRDFTINALYADPFTGHVHDDVGGTADIAARQVRFIGEPLQRIAEDHLRILRFFRFHARFGQGAPDAAGLAACSARANDLMALSRERIADELMKLLGMTDPAATVALMVDRGIFAPVIPEVVQDAGARLATLAAQEQEAQLAPAAQRRLAAILPRDPDVAAKVAQRLKLSNKALKRIVLASDPDLGANPRALAYAIGVEGAEDRLLLAGRAAEARALADWQVPRLPISGGDLIARGVTQGPSVARMLKAIERRWVDAGFPLGEGLDHIIGDALARSAE
ncbi:MAG TPA: CCA tRNA nucleotidyltransferase, partial [Sphingomicrobium sp.]|nr:CCA tRNA nucleotidyltransferase [Sphingomicrobium sp.]